MNYLVTGATGFIGQYLLSSLLEKGNTVYALVRPEESKHEALRRENVIPIVLDLDEIFILHSKIPDAYIDCCIHLAWEGSTGTSRGDYNIQLKNIKRTLDLCEKIAKLHIRRFVGIGSLAEKDTTYYIPLDEATPNTVAEYGVAKTSAHHMSKILCTKLGVEHIWCRLSNIYGQGDRSNNFINYTCKLMLNHEHAAFSEGTQMYDFVHVSDVAEAIILAAEKGRNNTNYYVGSGHQRRLREYIYDIRDEIDSDIELFLGEVPFNGVCLPDAEFDCSKLQSDTGYIPRIQFRDGIRETVNWIKQNLIAR